MQSKETIIRIFFEVLRMGLGAVLLVGGLVLVFIGIIDDNVIWPDWMIASGVTLTVGLLAMVADIVKDIWKLKIQLVSQNCELEMKKAATFEAQNFQKWIEKHEKEVAEWRKELKKEEVIDA